MIASKWKPCTINGMAFLTRENSSVGYAFINFVDVSQVQTTFQPTESF